MKKPILTTFLLISTMLAISCSKPSEPDSALNVQSDIISFTQINWVSTQLIYESAEEKKSLSLLYFTDDTCPDGVLMEANTFVDSAVIVELNQSYNIARVSTANDSLIYFNNSYITGNQLFKQYNLTGVPSMLVLDSDSKYFRRIQAGYYKPDLFLNLLQDYIEQSK